MKLYFHPASTTSRPVMLFAAENGIALDEQVVEKVLDEHILVTPRRSKAPPCIPFDQSHRKGRS